MKKNKLAEEVEADFMRVSQNARNTADMITDDTGKNGYYKHLSGWD